MSHFSTIKTQYKSKDSIVKALQAMGFEVQVHEQAVQLHGYKGDKRKQMAEIVVPRQNISSCSNDMGFRWVSETGEYVLHISDYDKGIGGCKPGQGLGPTFVSQMGAHYAIAQINADGKFVLTSELEQKADGSFTVRLKSAQTVSIGTGHGAAKSGGAASALTRIV